jgi:hypothetical protein
MNQKEQEIYDERVAICIYDGNLTEEEAREIAEKQIKDLRSKENEKNTYNGQ